MSEQNQIAECGLKPLPNLFSVALLVDCLDKQLVAYKTLSKYFMQVLSFVTLVHITQIATRIGPNYSAFTKQLQNFPVSASLLKFDVKINAATDNRRVPKYHEKRVGGGTA